MWVAEIHKYQKKNRRCKKNHSVYSLVISLWALVEIFVNRRFLSNTKYVKSKAH